MKIVEVVVDARVVVIEANVVVVETSVLVVEDVEVDEEGVVVVDVEETARTLVVGTIDDVVELDEAAICVLPAAEPLSFSSR